MSAYGISLAEITSEVTEPSSLTLSDEALDQIRERETYLKSKLESDLRRQDVLGEPVEFETYLNLQYKGMDTSLSVEEPKDGNYHAAFTKLHLREFAFQTTRDIVIDSIKVRGTAKRTANGEGISISKELQALSLQKITPEPTSSQKVFLEDSWEAIPVYSLNTMKIGSYI